MFKRQFFLHISSYETVLLVLPIILPVLRSIIEEIGRRPIQAPPGTFFDLGKMTSRKEYVHKRNAKRDATRKEYDNLPTPDIIRKKKDFTAAQLEAVADSIKRDTTIIRKDSLLLPLH